MEVRPSLFLMALSNSSRNGLRISTSQSELSGSRLFNCKVTTARVSIPKSLWSLTRWQRTISRLEWSLMVRVRSLSRSPRLPTFLRDLCLGRYQLNSLVREVLSVTRCCWNGIRLLTSYSLLLWSSCTSCLAFSMVGFRMRRSRWSRFGTLIWLWLSLSFVLTFLSTIISRTWRVHHGITLDITSAFLRLASSLSNLSQCESILLPMASSQTILIFSFLRSIRSSISKLFATGTWLSSHKQVWLKSSWDREQRFSRIES
jgi:hypothetical protein